MDKNSYLAYLTDAVHHLGSHASQLRIGNIAPCIAMADHLDKLAEATKQELAEASGLPENEDFGLRLETFREKYLQAPRFAETWSN